MSSENLHLNCLVTRRILESQDDKWPWTSRLMEYQKTILIQSAVARVYSLRIEQQSREARLH